MRLEAEGLGAQSFHLFLYRVDHKVMTLSVNAGARDARRRITSRRLFAHRAERLEGEYDAGFGIDMIRLGGEFGQRTRCRCRSAPSTATTARRVSTGSTTG